MQTTMPTAARLVAAVALGAVSSVMVFVLIAYYPDARFENDRTALLRVFFVIGALVGWYSLGKRVAWEEGGTGIGLGIRATITTAAWIVLFLAINHVIQDIIAERLRGAEPMTAVKQVFAKGMEYAAFLLHAKVAGIAIFMGICVGVLTRNTHYKWR